MDEKKKHPRLRIVRPEEEDRRADPATAPSSGAVNGPPVKRSGRADDMAARESGVESLPDGENAAAEEASKARDD
ncbi:MAG TPA: hypothetical protein VGM59_18200 [Dongiaceae bacterium]|jgi:hypothetical protein